MAGLDILGVLLSAGIPSTLQGTEAAMREIVARIDDVDRRSPTYVRAHARLDRLLTQRADLLNDVALQRCRDEHNLPGFHHQACTLCARAVRAERSLGDGLEC